MISEGFWSELPIDVKVEIFVRTLPANKLISLVDIKNLTSLKFVCKDWNFVMSSFCVPKLCPPNRSAGFPGFLYSAHDLDSDDSDSDSDSDFLTEKIRSAKALIKSVFKRIDSVNGSCTFEFRCKSVSAVGRILKKRIWSLFPSPDIEIRDCCNGLILFFASSNCKYYVGNPITSQRFDIPVNPNTSRSSLVFDPCVSFNESKDPCFKIVSFNETTVRNLATVDIYSSDKGEWCSSSVHILEPHQIYYGRFVYFNRALYFLSTAKYLVCIENIISASPDLRARAIALPDRDEKLSNYGCIGDCCGRFYYSDLNIDESFIFVWELRYSEWRLMHRISTSEDIGRIIDRTSCFDEDLIDTYKRESHPFRPCVFLPNDDGDEMIIYFGLGRSFLSYNVKTETTGLLSSAKKLKLDGNMIFPFSPCPLILMRDGCYFDSK